MEENRPSKDNRPLKHFRPPLKTDPLSVSRRLEELQVNSGYSDALTKTRISPQGRFRRKFRSGNSAERVTSAEDLGYSEDTTKQNYQASKQLVYGSGRISQSRLHSFNRNHGPKIKPQVKFSGSQNWRLGVHGPQLYVNHHDASNPVHSQGKLSATTSNVTCASDQSFHDFISDSIDLNSSVINGQPSCSNYNSLAAKNLVLSDTEVVVSSILISPEKLIMQMDTSCGYSIEDEPAAKQARAEMPENNIQRKIVTSSFETEDPSVCLSDFGLPTAFGRQKALKRDTLSYSQSNKIDVHLKECFSKNFEFKCDGWSLPDPALLFNSKPWELLKFQALKRHLNGVKSKLSNFPLNDWHQHTKLCNSAGSVIWQLRKKFNPELPTQAWCKFYEILSSLPVLSETVLKGKSLNSVHLCEAPGAFITALNHYLRTHYGADFFWQWRGSSLNPYHEGNNLNNMINDDRFILHTMENWIFGKDYSGNLMSKENLLHLLKETSALKEISLVTADGSIDCQDNPGEQEGTVSWLHYCEAIAAMNLLSINGSFVIKLFTFFECSSICLMYLLNCCFKTVFVTKPVTSKAGNSEVYVVCCGYFGAEFCRPWLNVLNEAYGSDAPPNALFPLNHIPDDFIEQVYDCSEMLTIFQEKTISENIRTFNSSSKNDRCITAAIRHRVAAEYFKRYKIVKLEPEYHLVKKLVLDSTFTPNLDDRMEDGTFNDRKRRLTMSPVEELVCLREDLDQIDVHWPCGNEILWLDFPVKPKGLHLIEGKAITVVNSSKFCLGQLLHIRNRVKDLAKNFFNIDVSALQKKRDVRSFEWPEKPVGEVISLDFKNELWASLEGSNSKHENKACQEILSTIEGMWRHQCLQLRGYPMLTQFNAGLIFLLGHLFQKVGLCPEGQDVMVLFYDFRKWDSSIGAHLQEVTKGMERKGGDSAFLSVVSILELSGGDFYKYLTVMNNLCVLEQVKELINITSMP